MRKITIKGIKDIPIEFNLEALIFLEDKLNESMSKVFAKIDTNNKEAELDYKTIVTLVEAGLKGGALVSQGNSIQVGTLLLKDILPVMEEITAELVDSMLDPEGSKGESEQGKQKKAESN